MSLLNFEKRLVPSAGPSSAKLAIVCEAPGAQEERMRRPLVGPAGQLFDKLAARAGLVRSELYLTNVIKERPVNNDLSQFIDLSKKYPRVTDEAQCYIDLLAEELGATQANCIVAMGNAALFALTGRKGISKLRGSILESTLLPGRKVVAAIHPAAALREYLFTYPIVWDLKRAKAQSEFPEIRRPDRNLLLRPTFFDVQMWLTESSSYNWLAVDIEILNEEISCLCIGNPIGTMCIPFVDESGDYFDAIQEAAIWNHLARLLEDPKIDKLGQNITFDSTFIFRKYGIRVRPVHDTMIQQGIAFPDFPKGLDFLTSVHTEEPYYKDDGKKWFKLGGTFEQLWSYNAKDGAVLPEIFSNLGNELKRQNNLDTYREQVELVEPLVYMQERGILVDLPGIKAESERAGAEIERLTKTLHDCCGFELNPASPKQLKDYFYETLGHRPYVNRKTGAPAVDRDALKRLSRKGVFEAQLLMQIRKLSKLKGTYLDMSIDSDSRIRCAFNPVGTTSGRLSSSQTIFGTGGNMQNLPLDFRRFLLFDPDYIGYQIDLGQAENRVVANIAPDPLMIEAFTSGMDVHSLTGSLISGLPYDEVKRQDEAGECCEIGGGLYTWRFWGKKANHGLNYDLGYRTFAFYYEIPENDAKFIVESYHKAYPGVRQYHAWVKALLSKDRTLTNCFGRKRLFLGAWSEELFKEAFSFIPQSSVADKVNRHGLKPAYYDTDRFEKLELLNQVHDSLIFQIPLSVPLAEHARMVYTLKRMLETPMTWRSREFIIPADCECSPPGGNIGKFRRPNEAEGELGNPRGLHKIKAVSEASLLEEIRAIANL